VKRVRWFGLGMLAASYVAAALARRVQALANRLDVRSRARDSGRDVRGRWSDALRAGRLAAAARERDLMRPPNKKDH